MSLKFAAVGSLTVLSPFGLPARAGDRARKLETAEAHDPLLAMLGLAGQAEQPKPPEAGKEPLTAHAHRRYTFVFDPMRSSESVTGLERSAEATGLKNMPVIVR